MNTRSVKKESREGTSFLVLPDGRELAYCASGGALPGVVFMGGFRSDMTGAKAQSLERWCREKNRRFLRFDYSGHGRSSGDFRDGTIGGWTRDALAMLDHVATGDNLLVGSSMGAWIMLLAALQRKERVRGLVGVASAPDFTEDLLWNAMTPAQQSTLLTEKLLPVASCNGQEPYPITLNLVEEGRRHLLLRNAIPLACPVRLIHGAEDEDVPWQVAVSLLQRLAGADVTLQLIKDGNHRLSAPEHLLRLHGAVAEVLALAQTQTP